MPLSLEGSGTVEINLGVRILERRVDFGQVGRLHVASNGDDGVLVVLGAFALEPGQVEVLCNLFLDEPAPASTQVWTTDLDRERGSVNVPKSVIVSRARRSVIGERSTAGSQVDRGIVDLGIVSHWCGQRAGSGNDGCDEEAHRSNDFESAVRSECMWS